MSRRRKPEIRKVLPDPKFKSELVSKFVNMLMQDGKKSVAEKIVYGALDQVTAKKGVEAPAEFLQEAFDHVAPIVEVKSRRVGGATYQVPVEVRASRRTTLAMRWVIDAASKRGEHGMQDRLAGELLDASENRGAAVKKREDTHKMAEANKAFSHFRW
ncbi:30S ribosomal protein S7 [Sinimarinibacterium sp. NLF-5-8]|uniref:30S ribosomal protein S7 n=1 Tax=Sinimarinibacterium sp. NLF-5-8 TaxID=2698684 RepID=UPI00137BB7BA|nr:30S ribosomal protein S7 [Sinimarinibacterium sp. NLF-5-8]QHS10984.1 30S ribosomal protein S7 [Sinimarinibacterium sp. NLF-5-8]